MTDARAGQMQINASGAVVGIVFSDGSVITQGMIPLRQDAGSRWIGGMGFQCVLVLGVTPGDLDDAEFQDYLRSLIPPE